MFEYSDSLQTEMFLDWLDQIECIFEYKKVHNKKVKLVTLKLTGQASAWWQQLKKRREGRDKPKNQD